MKAHVVVANASGHPERLHGKTVDETVPALFVPALDEAWVFAKLRQEINHLLDEFSQGFQTGFGVDVEEPAHRKSRAQFHTKIDINNTKKKIIVTVELPGLDPKDVQLSIDSKHLTIRGEKKTDSDKKDKDYYQRERHFGRFKRRLDLPCEIDKAGARASCTRGVLTITLPKAKHAVERDKKISIRPV